MSARLARLCLLLAAVVALAAPRAAHADPLTKGDDGLGEDITFFLGGANLGLVLDRGAEPSKLLGLEASVAHVGRKDRWYGGYVDGLFDGHRDGWRMSAGGEFGVGYLGIDGGPVAELDTDFNVDLRVRGTLTIGLVSLCAGPVIPVTNRNRDPWLEISLLVKYARARG